MKYRYRVEVKFQPDADGNRYELAEMELTIKAKSKGAAMDKFDDLMKPCDWKHYTWKIRRLP